MKNNNLLILLVLVSLGWVGCEKDLGNYTYQELNNITISNISQEYFVNQLDTLRITPTLQQSIPVAEENLMHLWRWRRQTGNAERFSFDTIGQTSTLVLPLQFITDTYDLEYYAIDRTTRVFYKSTSKVKIQGILGTGLMVLSKNSANDAVLSYIYPKGVIEDVFQANSAGSIGKNPVQISYQPKASTETPTVTVFCNDGKGGAILYASDLGFKHSYADLFAVRPSVLAPLGYVTGYSSFKATSSWSSYAGTLFTDLVNNNGQVYERYAISGQKVMNAAFSAPDALGYEAAPILLGSFVYTANILVYDRKNRRFLQKGFFPYHQLTPVTASASSPPFDPKNIGSDMELIYGDVGFTIGSRAYYYTIFQNTKENKHYFFKFNYQTTFVPLTKYELPFTPTPQTSYAQALHGAGMYYSEGSTIKLFNTDTKAISSILDLGVGNTITKLYLEPKLDDKYKFQRFRLYVGVSGPAVNGKEGSVYVYTVNTDYTLTLEESYKNIAHKIVDMAWKY